MVYLSVIVPSYNDGEYVLKLVDELRIKLNNIKHEIIIVESGNSDYKTKLNKDILFLESRKGRAIQMNHGFKRSKGNLLLFLHSDSSVALINFNNITNEIGWGGFRIRFDSKKKYFRFIEWNCTILRDYFSILLGDQGLIIKRDIFERINGFPEGGFEDIDISLKLRKIMKPIDIIQTLIISPRKFIKHGILWTHFIMTITLLFYILHFKNSAKKIYSAVC